ncbi:protein kinase [Streptomyces sp. NPDC048644]|uniref:protein kinase n=1 Tax=Streptomyces sp. NPDC048644 TaxID=3365582 RepID=UPI00371EDE89
MDAYAGRVLAERYRLPLRPAGDEDFAETRAFDTYSAQEVLLRQVPLPEVVEAEFADAEPGAGGRPPGGAGARPGRRPGTADRSPHDPVARRALEAAAAAAQLPDHPLLDQVFDVFVQDGSLWIAGELVAARPLSALLAEGPLTVQRAAEIAADVLTALRALHAHGWTHRNLTARTVLVCHDGRAMLTGLAVGAAQEALCGGDPVPREGAGPAQAEPRVQMRKQAATAHGAAEGARAVPAGVTAAGAGEGPGTGAYPARVGGDGAGAAPGAGPSGGLPAPRSAEPPGASAPDLSIPRVPAPAGPPQDAAPGGRPGAALAAERARQARLQVIGPVTERWAPELAGPQASPGAAADLWAVGALLFRCVQGRPPFPEESSVELARLVRAQLPAAADGCGRLRPVVEALLSRDPAARPGFDELRVLLWSVIRTAPEPDLGGVLVTVPAPGAGGDPRRLPIVRRRGELVRTGRSRRGAARRARADRAAAGTARRSPDAVAPRPAKRPKRQRAAPVAGAAALDRPGKPSKPSKPQRHNPRHLGRLLLALILLLVVGAVVYAMVFLPKAGSRASGPGGAMQATAASGTPSQGGQHGGASGTGSPQTTAPAGLADGFEVRKDPEGFQVGVRNGWQRRAANDRGQVRYVGGGYELVIVPGRDTTAKFGADPMAYQQDKEPELAPYRGSGWATASGLRRTDVGRTAMAEGTFTWKDSSGREVYVRNLAMIHDGRYHLVQVIGPHGDRREVDRYYDQATGSYRPA